MTEEIVFLNKILFQDTQNELVIFDIGANIGEYSLELIKIGNKSIKQIYAFEPLKDFYSQLVMNTILIPKIKTYNLAIDDKDTEKKMFQLCSPFDYAANGMSSFYWRDVFNKYPYLSNVSVKCTTLDSFIKENEINKIDLIKIDTEGHELNVLKSLEETLKSQKVNFIQFEYGGCFIDSNITMNDIINYVNKFNYTVFKIKDDKIINLDNFIDDYNHENYFIKKNENITD